MEENIILDKDNIEIVEMFSCIGNVLSTEGMVHDDVTSRIRSTWKNFNKVFIVLCKKGTLRINGSLYKCYVRSTLSTGTECWPLRVEDERRLKTNEMRMLRMLCCKNLKDKISNEKIRKIIKVEGIDEFLKKQ